jgi:hypothetical protein
MTKTRETVCSVSLVIMLSLLFWSIHSASPNLFGVDGYFHIRYSQMLRTEGIIYDFPWLTHTILREDFADDHFLFHLAQIPFTFGNLITGAKVYATVVASCVFFLFYQLLRLHQIKFALIWTLGLLVSADPFLYRLCMARAAGLSLILLLVATHLILRRRDRWIGPLSFVYVWLYGAFPLVAILAGTAFCVSWAMGGGRRYELLIFCGCGIMLGLVCNPYFPHNLTFLFTSYTQVEFGAFPDLVKAGIEDYPYASSSAVRNALLVWAVTFVVVVMYLVRPAVLDANTLILFLFSTVLLCLYLNVRRFIEYWPSFAFLFAAFALNPFLARIDWSSLKPRLRALVSIAVLATLGATGHATFSELLADQQTGANHRHFEGASKFLRESTEKGAIVFASNWADFPLLFHFNSHNRYIVGMGVHYMYLLDSKLYERWERIAAGKDPTPSESISEYFGAEYIFTLKTRRSFLDAIKSEGRATVVYEDDYALVYQADSGT